MINQIFLGKIECLLCLFYHPYPVYYVLKMSRNNKTQTIIYSKIEMALQPISVQANLKFTLNAKLALILVQWRAQVSAPKWSLFSLSRDIVAFQNFAGLLSRKNIRTPISSSFTLSSPFHVSMPNLISEHVQVILLPFVVIFIFVVFVIKLITLVFCHDMWNTHFAWNSCTAVYSSFQKPLYTFIIY